MGEHMREFEHISTNVAATKNKRAGSLLRARPQEKQLYNCTYLPETMDTKYSESSARFAVERRACSFAASIRSVQIS